MTRWMKIVSASGGRRSMFSRGTPVVGVTKLSLVLVVVLALVAAACGGSPSDAPADSPATTEPAANSTTASTVASADSTIPGGEVDSPDITVLIGHIAHLSGVAATPFGIPFDGGTKAGLDRVEQAGFMPDNVTLDLQVEDDGTEAERAAAHFVRFVTDGAPVILSSAWTPVGTALWPLANDAEVVLITGGTTGGAPDEVDYFFRLPDLVTPHVELASHMIEDLGLERIGLIVDGDNPGFGLMASGFEEGLKASGLDDFVRRESVSTQEADFSSVLTNLAQADVDAIVLMVASAQAGNVLRQASQQGGFEEVVFAGNQGNSPEVAAIAGSEAVGYLFPQPWISPPDEEFVQIYEAEHGEQPGAYFAYGHDTIALIAAAVDQLVQQRETVTGPSLRDAITTASATEAFQDLRLIENFEMNDEGFASFTSQIATLNDAGRIVPLD